jgi:hypothetical protein
MDGRARGDADRDGAAPAQTAVREQVAQLGQHRQRPLGPELPGVGGRFDQLSKGRSTVDHAPGHFSAPLVHV